MKSFASLALSMLLVIFCYSLLVSAQGTPSPWSTWACFNGTAASRNRTVQNCTDMEFTDPVTNMTTTNTTCIDMLEIARRTDVISANTWSSWGPVLECSMTGFTISQFRTSSCRTADPECSNNCIVGRNSTRTVDAPLCCELLNWSTWTSWAPACSSATTQQTRQRYRIPCDPGFDCQGNCSNGTDTRSAAPTVWSDWGPWNPVQEQMCGSGVRIRQRTCINISSVFCDVDCTFGAAGTENQCCVVRNMWTTWGAWINQCPGTRMRTRNCVADPSVAGLNVSQPTCTETCGLNTVDRVTQPIVLINCTIASGLPPTSSPSEGFPTWAIGVISAVGVILVIGGFLGITFAGRYFTRRSEYSIGEAARSAEREYEKMHEGVPPSGYQPTEATLSQEGIPGTVASDTLKFTEYKERQF